MPTPKKTRKTGIILLFTLTTIAGTSCGNRENKGEATFATDSVTFALKDAQAEAAIYVDAPTGGSEALRRAIGEYVSETLGGTYKGGTENVDSIVDYYGREQHKELARQRKEDGGEMTYFWSYDIRKIADTERYVTYTAACETFLGGAHGSHTLTGQTFRKTDGRRLGWEMLRQTDSESFRQLIKTGLIEYFNEQGMNVATDKELQDCLATESDVNYLPLPTSLPYLCEKGIVLTYQSYEIAPYAVGTPQFCIPFDKALPYLTQTAIDLTK